MFQFSKTIEVGNFKLKAFYNDGCWWCLVSVRLGVVGTLSSVWVDKELLGNAVSNRFYSKERALEEGLVWIKEFIRIVAVSMEKGAVRKGVE